MKTHRFFAGALALVCAAGAFADGSISRPVAGYFTDGSRAQLRPIFGVPGALSFGDPLPLPNGVSQVRLAPGQDFALVERAGDTPAVLFLKDGAVDRVAPVSNGLANADWVAFSAGARSAMLYSSAANRLQVLTGLPDAPRVAVDVEASVLPEAPAAGALSDDGSLVVVASATALYRVPSQGAAQMLLATGGIQSVIILRNGTDVAVSDSSTGSLHVVRNAGSKAEARVLASGLDGIGAIFPSADGRSLYVARPGAATVSSVDLSSGEVQSVAMQAAPEGLLPLRNRDTFLVSAKSHEPGWIFYQDGAAGRTVFIPAAQSMRRELPGKGDHE